MDCSMPGFPVFHYFLGFTQTHVHWASDAIQSSHLLLPSYPFAFNISQNRGLFQWVASSYQVAKVMELQLQCRPSNKYSVLISCRIYWLDLLAVQGLSRVFSSTIIQKHILHCLVFFMVQHSHPWLTDYWQYHSFNYMDLYGQSDVWYLICCLGQS